MALREKLAERMQPHLEPGEQIQAVMMAQTGPTPYFAFLSVLIVLFGAKYYVLAVTDRAIVVARASALVPSKVKAFEGRLPQATRLGPTSGLWLKTNLLGRPTYIAKRFHKDVNQADSYLGGQAMAPPPPGAVPPPPAAPAQQPAATPAGWYPDPNDASQQRYYDGSAWTEHTAPR